MSLPPSQLQYRPTALERAYASHLLQTYFQTPHTPNDISPVRLSGRQAVPFLTTSGVERTLLRLFWSVADPDAVGTLVIRNQFHLLLRLVAMAQAHFLPPLTNNNANTDTTDAEKVAILTKTLQDNSHLVIALPTFSADSCCPSVAYLLGTFPSPSSREEHSSNNHPTNNNGNPNTIVGGNNHMDVSSMLTNHDLQYQLWQQKQQQQQNQQQQQDICQGGVHMMSVSDAFGSLPEVEDRPLPPLQFDTPTTTSAAVEDVKSLPPATTVVDTNGNVNGIMATEGNMNNDMEITIVANDEGFGDFDGSNNPMQAKEAMGSGDANPISSATAAIAIENDEDDFGGFESTPNNDFSDIKTESSAEDNNNEAESADDADFGDFSDSLSIPPAAVAPATAEEEMTIPPPANNAAQSSSAADYMAEETSNIIAFGNNTAGHTLSVSDAFDALVSQEDPPIQFGQMNTFEGVAGDAKNVIVNDSDDNVEEDDFGNFDSADTTTAVPPSLEEKKAHDDEDFASNNNIEGPPTASSFGMSVFDAFGDVEDKPLPPLGGFPSIANDETEAMESEEDDGFGFGSFEATVEAETSNVDAPVDDSFGTFEGADVTTAATGQNVDAPVGDSFGTFEGVAVETAETKPNEEEALVEDSFGTFEGVGGEGGTVESEQNTDSHPEIPTVSSDPFSSLPEVENLPLPPLQSPFFEQKKSLEASAPEEDDDDFGDFGSVPIEPGAPDGVQSSHSEVENPEQIVVSHQDDFGGFERTAVAAENTAEIVTNDDAEEDDFGAFGDATVSQVNNASPVMASSKQSFPTPTINTNDFSNFNDSVSMSEEKKSNEDEDIGGVVFTSEDKGDGEEPKTSFGMSAFDAFGDIEDAPLPALNFFAPTANNETDELEGNDEDSFGAFGGTTETEPNVDAPVDDSFGTFEDAAVSTVEAPNVDAPVEDSFGTFEGVAEETAEPESSDNSPVDDSFGTFEGVVNEAAQEKANVDALVEDSFGTFDGVAEEAPETRSNKEKDMIEDSFGTFEGVEEKTAEIEQNIASQPENHAISFGLPSPSLSDPFGSLPEVENLPLPPLTSPPLVERKLEEVASEVEENRPDSENDDFGDFGSVPIQADEGASDVLHNESKQMDEDDFGGFESSAATSQFQANEDMFDTATDDANDITIDALSETQTPPKNDEDEFGDFGEAQVPALPLDAASTDIDAAANANNATDPEDNFGFGDWGSGDWQGQAPPTNKPAPALATDILSSGFDAFSEPAPELTAAATDEQITPTTPNGENDDEFGNFEAPKSDVTQDEGSEGFVFVDNTESNSQFDAFGDFSSPTSESFSAFDSAADEEKIMQPELEDTDGFGDFSSFEDGAQQQEQANEKSSRQELIGTEYTNLMERWASIASTVKADVARGQKIIEYVSTTLPSSDRAIILKSSKLHNHILGLAEFVRVVRCIAATIADVFCLSDSIDLEASYLPEWNDNPIIADAIAIETLWSEISSRVIELNIIPCPPQLDTVVEIRARAKVATVQQKDDLCHLTLQPFVNKKCTQSSVDWDGNKYMACAANLLLHRMS